MGSLRNVIIAIFAISFLTFVAFFGRLPSFRNTPIGFLHRVLWIHTPNLLRNLDVLVTGGRTFRALKKSGHYLFNRKHPLVLVCLVIHVLRAFVSLTNHSRSFSSPCSPAPPLSSSLKHGPPSRFTINSGPPFSFPNPTSTPTSAQAPVKNTS